LRDEESQAELAALQPDLMIVAAYGLILPETVLKTPRLGCINIHGSLLPRWRGAAPIHRAILAGDTVTGVTIMQMNEGLDTGDMLYKSSCAIEKNDTTGNVHDRLAILGASALLTTLENLNKITPEKQTDKNTTYATKIATADATLDGQTPAIDLDRHIRAFNPWPIAQTSCSKQIIRVWEAELSTLSTIEPSGTIIQATREGIDVATTDGVLRLLRLQLPNRRPLHCNDLINANSDLFSPGLRLGIL
jgi:methionyl-tRNA formyltransferase